MLFRAFLITLLTMLGVVVLLVFIPAAPATTAMPHPQYDSMLIGGSGILTYTMPQILAYLFGLCVITIFVCCLAIGYRKNGELKENRRWFVGGLGVYLLLFSTLVIWFWQVPPTESNGWFLGFPGATAWMIYGLWLYPLFFTLFYFLRFNNWTYNEADEKRFREILAQRKDAPRGSA